MGSGSFPGDMVISIAEQPTCWLPIVTKWMGREDHSIGMATAFSGSHLARSTM